MFCWRLVVCFSLLSFTTTYLLPSTSPLHWPSSTQQYDLHDCIITPQRTIALPSNSCTSLPHCEGCGKWFFPSTSSRLGYCFNAKYRGRSIECEQATSPTHFGWYFLAISPWRVYQHQMINSLPSLGMAIPWIKLMHTSLNLTIICDPLICDLLHIPIKNIRVLIANEHNLRAKGTYEHLIVSIPQFGFPQLTQQMRRLQWDSYPCGSYAPFIFNQTNLIPTAHNTSPQNTSQSLKVLFLSRATNSHRRLLNEEELINNLHQMKSHTLHIFHHTTHTNDIHLFQEADVVLGVHGGAFANLFYCRPSTIVIEMNIPEESGRQCYAYMSFNLNLRYYRYGVNRSDYLLLSDENEMISRLSFYDRDILVDIRKFLNFYHEVLRKEKDIHFSNNGVRLSISLFIFYLIFISIF
jgi:hypothetical protein